MVERRQSTWADGPVSWGIVVVVLQEKLNWMDGSVARKGDPWD